jgi:catalase
MPVGKMVLNRNPENYFAETEQAAFCPASIVPGIELSADKLLQGRVFSYADTQRHRLGPNYLQLAINRPHVPVNNNQRDGFMQSGSFQGVVNYEPNTLGGGMPREALSGPTSIYRVDGEITQRKIGLTNNFAQAGARFRSLDSIDQDHLIDNIVDSLEKADKPIQERMAANFTNADRELGTRVTQGLHS